MSSSTNNIKSFCPNCGFPIEDPIEKHFTPKEVAEIFGCSELTIRKLVWKGKIGHTKVGRLTRIPQSELELIGEYHPPVSELVKKKAPKK